MSFSITALPPGSASRSPIEVFSTDRAPGAAGMAAAAAGAAGAAGAAAWAQAAWAANARVRPARPAISDLMGVLERWGWSTTGRDNELRPFVQRPAAGVRTLAMSEPNSKLIDGATGPWEIVLG